MGQVLVIDPYERERGEIARLMRAANYQVVEARGQAEALILLQENPDAIVVLAEETLPGPGADLIVYLREMTRAPIVMIGEEKGVTEMEALFLGADHYARRPISPAKLTARIWALSESWRRRQTSPPEPDEAHQGEDRPERSWP